MGSNVKGVPRGLTIKCPGCGQDSVPVSRKGNPKPHQSATGLQCQFKLPPSKKAKHGK